MHCPEIVVGDANPNVERIGSRFKEEMPDVVPVGRLLMFCEMTRYPQHEGRELRPVLGIQQRMHVVLGPFGPTQGFAEGNVGSMQVGHVRHCPDQRRPLLFATGPPNMRGHILQPQRLEHPVEHSREGRLHRKLLQFTEEIGGVAPGITQEGRDPGHGRSQERSLLGRGRRIE